MTYIPKPINREGILIFGDGDMALFLDKQMAQDKGYDLLIFKPLDKMKYSKQIQDWEYDIYDRLVKKIYKRDLCIPLNDSPDFPTWLLLCNYRGSEDTPAMRIFGDYIKTIRDLKRKTVIDEIKLNRIRAKSAVDAMHPDQEELKFLERVKRFNASNATKEIIIQKEPQMDNQTE